MIGSRVGFAWITATWLIGLGALPPPVFAAPHKGDSQRASAPKRAVGLDQGLFWGGAGVAVAGLATFLTLHIFNDPTTPTWRANHRQLYKSMLNGLMLTSGVLFLGGVSLLVASVFAAHRKKSQKALKSPALGGASALKREGPFTVKLSF